MRAPDQELMLDELKEFVEPPPLQDLIGGYSYGYENLAAFLRAETIISQRLGEMCPDIYEKEAERLYRWITSDIGFLEDLRSSPDYEEELRGTLSAIVEGELTIFVSDIVDPGVDGIRDSVSRDIENHEMRTERSLTTEMWEAYKRDKAIVEGQGRGH